MRAAVVALSLCIAPGLALADSWMRTEQIPGTKLTRTVGADSFVISHHVPGARITVNTGTIDGRSHFSHTLQTSPTSNRTMGADTFYTTSKIPGTNLYGTSGTLNGRPVFKVSAKPGLNGFVRR